MSSPETDMLFREMEIVSGFIVLICGLIAAFALILREAVKRITKLESALTPPDSKSGTGVQDAAI